MQRKTKYQKPVLYDWTKSDVEIALRFLIGARVKWFRTSDRLSQAELAQEAQIRQATLSDLESGAVMPTLLTLFLLSRALGLKLIWLLPAPGEIDKYLRESGATDG